MGAENGPVQPPAAPAPSSGLVAADINTLADFRSFVGQELDAVFRPGVDGIGQDHIQGAAWGQRFPGHEFFLARMRYFEAQRTAIDAMYRYIEMSEELIDAIRRISAAYDAADTDAEVSFNLSPVGRSTDSPDRRAATTGSAE
jgi:hypothetical protein